MKIIVVVDYEMGNLGSIVNMLKKIGAKSQVTSDKDLILSADKLILPGVGAFDNGMMKLHDLGLTGILEQAVIVQRKPVLGICLGAQLMTKGSEEGRCPGLGWLDITTRRFRFAPERPLKIPHMGWNLVMPTKQSRLFHDMPDPARFYFVHSYYMECNDLDDQLTQTDYGFSFASSYERGNISGVQFHPEKSHKYGIRLMRNFVETFGNA